MTDAELAELVAGLREVGGDHLDVEAKASETELPKHLWHSLSAFANASGGGVIVLGLDERSGFRAVGVRHANKLQQDLASLCDQMEPPLRPQIRPHKLERATVIVAEVPEIERALKPCYYKGAGITNGSFVRVADGNRRLSSYEVQVLLASRGQPREDEVPVSGTTRRDLDADLVTGLVERVRTRSRNLAEADDETILRTLKVLVPDGATFVPSLAATLALGRHPQHSFPSLFAQFVVYPTERVGGSGPDDARFVDNRRFEGPIAAQLGQLVTSLRPHMSRKTLIRGTRREDSWQYPETALREAIVNALVHRDLSDAARGTPIQVQMFPDRLVVMNPGGLFGPVTVDRLGEDGVSAARNATLVRILEDAPGLGGAPICENRGSGIGAMIQALRRAGLEPPQFDDRIATFIVTFPNASLLDDETVRWLSRFHDLSEEQRLGLALLRHGHVLDNTTFRQATGLDSRVATRELGALVDKRVIEQVGTRRWATYRLASTGKQRRDRRAEIISVLRRRGELSRSEIARELELNDAAIRPWLSVLRESGALEAIGPTRSPKTRYRLKERRKR
ncbi:MAG TPA: ATP-binding protein [Kofleriaceae bacterium]|jgi:ATP-dependent DNA helicase RecG